MENIFKSGSDILANSFLSYLCKPHWLPPLKESSNNILEPETPRCSGGRSQSLRPKLPFSCEQAAWAPASDPGLQSRMNLVFSRKEEPLEMSSNNDPVANAMIERNPSDILKMDTSEGSVLSFHNISYREMVHIGFLFCKITNEKKRLSNVSGIMKPGLNAIMGPQDGSRSLLLDILAARKDPRELSGDILINGKPRPANFKCTSGYVPQDDLVISTVSLRDNIEFSAALRLPMMITKDERKKRINEVLELLHLNEVSNEKPRSKELKKRTSIAMELVVEHPILFLDDPTTGLDMRTIIDIISVLKRISMRGRTIIFSINHAQYSIFRFFDSLTLVSSGKVMFHGPAQEALEYLTCVDLLVLCGYKYDFYNNPADFFLDIIYGGFSAILDTEEDGHNADKYTELYWRQQQVTEELAKVYEKSDIYRDIRTKLDLLLEKQAGMHSALEEITCVTPFWHQFRCIICRLFKIFIGFPRKNVIQAIVTVIMAMVIGTAFYFLQNDCAAAQIRAGLLFFLTVSQCVRSMSTGDLFMTDRDRFLHEHSSGYYSMSSYFFGKLLAVFIPMIVLPSIIFTVIVFSIAGIHTDVKGFFIMLFTIMMLVFCASSLALAILPLENLVAVPTLFVTIYFVFMPFFAGLSFFAEDLVPELSWTQYINILHYGFTALLHNEFLGQNFCPEHKIAEINRCRNFVICTGEEFLTAQGIDLSSWGFWKNHHVALTCTTIIFLTIAYLHQSLSLKKRDIFYVKWIHREDSRDQEGGWPQPVQTGDN
ncbi:ATP-binding cassette sub-family G member 3-like [Sigmodon hispidus]